MGWVDLRSRSCRLPQSRQNLMMIRWTITATTTIQPAFFDLPGLFTGSAVYTFSMHIHKMSPNMYQNSPFWDINLLGGAVHRPINGEEGIPCKLNPNQCFNTSDCLNWTPLTTPGRPRKCFEKPSFFSFFKKLKTSKVQILGFFYFGANFYTDNI